MLTNVSEEPGDGNIKTLVKSYHITMMLRPYTHRRENLISQNEEQCSGFYNNAQFPINL